MTERIVSPTRFITVIYLGLAFQTTIVAQAPPDPDFVRQEIFATYQDFKNELNRIVSIDEPAQRDEELDAFWTMLQDAGQVPYAQGNQVAFLYRGSATNVSWPGDFNGWNPSASSWRGTPQGDTDLMILEKTFPEDARLDYKLFANGNWILDPANSLQMWGGFGPNSELRMPDYVFPQETVRQSGIPQGNLTNNITTFSTSLDYAVNYRVFTPSGYEDGLSDLPVVYVTDGHEYAADYLGSMTVVMDNLIAEGRIRPTIAVFIDPRDPSSGTNRRGSEYVGNPDFAAFVAGELVPEIDGAYRSLASPSGRTILGTSLGGVNAAYFGGTRSDVFENIAIQSPSNFSSIFNLYATQSLHEELDLFITAGTIGDGIGGSQLASLLQANGYEFEFVQTNEGHSWGNWRALLDEILINLVGPIAAPSADFDEDGDVDGEDFLTWQGGFGTPNGAVHADGDADLDGDVDGHDFLTWQSQFGSGGAASGDPVVPESAGCALAVILILGTFVQRKAA